MSRAVLSAGSNVGDPEAHLASVVERLGPRLVAVSSVYATAPWGGVAQDEFRNITLIADSPADPDSEADDGPADAPGRWLDLCVELEAAADRTRDVRWGPRTLDVDVITISSDGRVVVSDDPDLTLPHPRAAQRAFVLMPWLEIDPEAALWTPDGVRTVAALVDGLGADERAGVRRLGTLPGPGDRR